MVFDPEAQPELKRVVRQQGTKHQFQRTITVSNRQIDMLESAIGQLVEREPEYTETARVFCLSAGLNRVLKMIESLKDTAKKKQQELFLDDSD